MKKWYLSLILENFMIFALAKCAAFIDGFNSRALTEKDFYAICEREAVEVVFDDMPVLLGFTAKCAGRNYIFLDQSMRGAQFLFVAFHELAHFVLHEPRTKKAGVTFYSLCRPSKEDDEADAAALVALFPTTSLPRLEDDFFDDNEDDFLHLLIKRRKLIFQNFGV